MFIFSRFEIFSNSRSGAIAEPFRENCSENREIKRFFQYLKWIPFAVKFPSQRYTVLGGVRFTVQKLSVGADQSTAKALKFYNRYSFLSLVSITRQMPRPRHKNKTIMRLSSHPSR